MLLYPSVPESHNDMLEDASNRDSEEPSNQSEEFCTCEERENGHDGMHSHGSAENAWCKYLPHHNPQEKHHENSHDQHDSPSLWESRQDTQRRYQIRAYHWKKIQEKEKDRQHSCIRNMQECKHNSGTQSSSQRKQKRTPKIPAQALVKCM